MADIDIVHARDCEIGKTYLLVLGPSSVYKITIKSIGEMGVGVDDERYPGQTNTVISGDTSLIEYDEVFYSEAKGKRIVKAPKNKDEENSIKKEDKVILVKVKGEKMSQNKNTRSKTIDKMLSEVPENTVPDWNLIVDAVLKESKGDEKDRSNIIFQAKMRHKWYTKQGKVNPYSTLSKVE